MFQIVHYEGMLYWTNSAFHYCCSDSRGSRSQGNSSIPVSVHSPSKLIGHVSEYPSIHYFGIPRHTHPMKTSKILTEYFWKFQWKYAWWGCCWPALIMLWATISTNNNTPWLLLHGGSADLSFLNPIWYRGKFYILETLKSVSANCWTKHVIDQKKSIMTQTSFSGSTAIHALYLYPGRALSKNTPPGSTK